MEMPLASYHHGDLRAAVLKAARAALEAETGGGDLSLRRLAAGVGVSPNAPYRHFPTKESLLGALAAQGFGELTDRFSPYAQAAGSARMEGCLKEYLLFARENPALYRLMFGRNLDPLSCEPLLGLQAQACFVALMAVVAQVMELPQDTAAVRAGAAIVWSLSHGAALLDIDRSMSFLPEAERPDAAALARVVLSGLESAKLQ